MKLYQISDLLSRRIDQKDILFNGNSEEYIDKRIKQIYDGLNSGEFKNDEEAISTVYGITQDNPYYFEIKAKFRDQLLKNIFHLNLNSSKYHYYYRQELECEISLMQAKILLRNSLKQNAIWQFKRTLRIAESFKFYSIISECARFLKNQMVYDGDLKKFNFYRDKWNEAQPFILAEMEAEDLLSQLRVKSQKSTREINSGFDFSKMVLDRITELKNEFQTPMLIQMHSFIANSYFMRTSDWESNLKFIDELEEKSAKYPDKYVAIRMKNLHVSKLYALILLNRIEEGLKFIDDIMEEYRGDEIAYFIIKEDHFLLLMRDRKYEEALEVVNSIMTNKYLEMVPAVSRERWDIYQEYALYFCNRESNHDISLINYFPNYSKDKIGFNIQILILQIMILLRKGNEDVLYNHIENLRYYEIRQISKADNRRAQYFLRLIRLLVNTELDYEKCKKLGNKYYNLLLKFPEKDQPYSEVEIIPYESLWNHILKSLKNKELVLK